MSRFPRFPNIINRVIEINWLEQETSQFIPEFDSRISVEVDQTGLFPPFQCTFKGNIISDGFYFISSTTEISLPLNSNILATE